MFGGFDYFHENRKCHLFFFETILFSFSTVQCVVQSGIIFDNLLLHLMGNLAMDMPFILTRSQTTLLIILLMSIYFILHLQQIFLFPTFFFLSMVIAQRIFYCFSLFFHIPA